MEKTIKLSGRIDSNNIEDLEKRIDEEIANVEDIIFDAEDLEYISSAGLRTILKVKKTHDNTKVINCNQEVYEIFNMTGFTEIMNIEKGLRTISVDNCEVIGEGFYGTVYRINPETIVKVYKVKDSYDMVKKEKELARKAFVLGIPTAIPYDIVKVGDSYGSVFELLDCKSLDQEIRDGGNIETLASSCVEILKKMHSIEMNDNSLPNKKDEIIKMANSIKENISVELLSKIIKFINNIEDKNTLIHGDFHIKNLMKQKDEVLLIDMDKLSIGNPIFEFGAMHATYVGFACINKNNPDEFLGITLDQSNEIWNYIFNNYYKDKTEEEKEKLLEQIKIISYLEVLYYRTMFKDDKNKYQEEEIEYTKNYLTNNIDKVLEIMN